MYEREYGMDLLKEFLNPDKDYSVLAFWFLNGELKEDTLKQQMREMVEKGVYGGFLHPRAYLKTPYLEEEWWKMIGVCITEAEKLGFTPWLYDEYAWPSGSAGSTFEYGYQKPSRILAAGEQNMAKGLYAKKFSEETCWEQFAEDPEDQLYRVIKKDGMYYVFYRHVFEKAVDYLNPETIADFIKLTHEEYKKRYGEKFGSLIPGIFFDEIFMMGNPIPWTEKLPQQFQKTYGYDITEKLPSLIDGEAEADKRVRKDYFELIASMYETAFFKQISEWCEENQLKLTGHTEEFLWEQPRRQGNYFDTMRHLMIPGSDCHDYRYSYPRKITYSEPKYAVSVARAYGKERAMSEAMGGAGWNCSVEEFKRGINVLAAMGTNMFILHGFYYECEHQGSQSDWPTSFFYQNPYWKYFGIFAKYVQRICYMNSIGTPVVPYGILYPAADMQENMEDGRENGRGRAVSEAFHKAFHTMIEHQMDTDMVDEASIERAEIREGKLCVGLQRFEMLLLPQGCSLKETTKEKLANFRESGGKVWFYETGCSEEIEEIWRDCPRYSTESLPQEIEKQTNLCAKVIYGEKRNLYVNHREIDGKESYFIVNGSEEKKNIIMSFAHLSTPVLLDIETGEAKRAEYKKKEDRTVVSLSLREDEAVYLIFGLDSSEKREQVESGEIVITGKWNFNPLDEEDSIRWSEGKEECELEIPLAKLTTDLSDDSKLIRICNAQGEEGRCARHFSLWSGAWITRRASWNDQLDAADLYFRTSVYAEGIPKSLSLCLAAVDSVIVYINGVEIYRGVSDGKPIEITNTHGMKVGENILAVHVINHHPLNDVYVCSSEELPRDRFNSLLMEGYLETANGRIKIQSDASWFVNDIEEDGWNQIEDAALMKNLHFDVQRVQNFNTEKAGHGWLAAWERGTPPIQPWGELPLFGKTVDYPRTLYYQVTIPAGTRKIYKPEVSGNMNCRLDGKPVDWENGCLNLEAGREVSYLTVEVEVFSGEGGLKKPIKVLLQKRKINLSDWRNGGIEWFSGRGRYQTFWNVKKQEDRRYILDLGDVRHCAEIWVNHQLVSVKIWKPYQADITEYLLDGENELVIIVSNLASNARRHMLVDEGMALGWNRYWNEDNMDRECENYVSGLLGPVKIICQREKEENR